MKLFGIIWGVGGVLTLLAFAIYRLSPMVFELEALNLSLTQWAALLFSVVYMAYAEGYKGFHKGFAPRVVMRARYLGNNPRIAHVLAAPLFCMGYFNATRKRMILSYGLTVMILCFIAIARLLPQPWRGIVDAGVVVGLSIGIASILYFLLLAKTQPNKILVATDVPGHTN